MTGVAFYAPMKSPDHPVPSGDRSMARALLTALNAAGFETEVASHFQSRDGKGDANRQAALLSAAEAEVDRLIPLVRQKGWTCWISYHNYYKAPDLVGPKVAAALDIPYLLVEATRARKRFGGPWDSFAHAAESATDAAHTVFYLTNRDAEALRSYAPPGQILRHLPPFLPRTELGNSTTRSADLLAVGMFRAGDKVASYKIIAETLSQLNASDWQLEIVGDGPERATVEGLMRPFGNQVTFLGALDAEAMQSAYERARLLIWPGVNEAFGMVYLEAQAAGLTVLAQDRPGVRDVLAPNAAYPDPEAGGEALARRLDLLLSMPKLVTKLGQGARHHVGKHHLLGSAQETLRKCIEEALK